MSKFDMIIGYGAVKKELKQIADTLKNREYYEKLADALSRKKLLSAADVQKIKGECKLVPVTL